MSFFMWNTKDILNVSAIFFLLMQWKSKESKTNNIRQKNERKKLRFEMTWGWVYFWVNYLFNSESLVFVVTDKCNPGQLSWSNKLQAQFYLHRVQDNPISSNYVGLYCSPEHLETSQPALHDFFFIMQLFWNTSGPCYFLILSEPSTLTPQGTTFL